MEYSAVFILATLSLFATIQAEDSNGHSVGNIQSNHPPPIKLDPKLRRALLRVLTKLEEEEKNNENFNFDKMPMGNIVTEQDFISYFNSKDAQTQLFDATSKEDDQVIKIDQNYKRAPGEQLKFSLYDPSGEKHNPEEILNGPFLEKYKSQELDEMRMKEVEELAERVKFVSTEPSPQDAIFFQIPHPIEIPTSSLDGSKFSFTNDSLNAQETRNIISSQTESIKEDGKDEEKSISENEVAGNDDEDEEDEKTTGNSTTKTKPEKHEVEFFGAPLLTAFTVQQDQQGLPRRVIPLDYRSNGGEPIPLPTIKEQEEQEAKERELQEKQRILEQQLFEQRERLRLLQQQQFQPQPVFGNSENSQFRFSDNEQRNSPQYYEQLRSQQQILLANQQRQQLSEIQQREQQRLTLLEQARQKQQALLLNPQRQEEQERLLALREQERLRLLRKEEELRNQQSFNFQRSVDFQFRPSQPLPNQFGSSPVNPFNQFQQSAELNRVNRGESNRFVGNLGFNNVIPTPVPTPDAQLQNLIFRSGVKGDIKTTGSQEDINIVSKVLALNHGAQLQQFQNQQQSFVSQQSNNDQQNFVQQPQNSPLQSFVQQQPNTFQHQNFVQQQPSVSQNFVQQQQSNSQNFVQQQQSNPQNFVQQQSSVSQNFAQQPSVSQNFVQQQPSVSQNFVQQPSVSQNFVQQPSVPQNFEQHQPSAPQNFAQQPSVPQNFQPQTPQNFVPQTQQFSQPQPPQNFVQQPQNFVQHPQHFTQQPQTQQNFVQHQNFVQPSNTFQPIQQNSIHSFTNQHNEQFRPREILGQHSSKVSKVVRAPSRVIEPPFP